MRIFAWWWFLILVVNCKTRCVYSWLTGETLICEPTKHHLQGRDHHTSFFTRSHKTCLIYVCLLLSTWGLLPGEMLLPQFHKELMIPSRAGPQVLLVNTSNCWQLSPLRPQMENNLWCQKMDNHTPDESLRNSSHANAMWVTIHSLSLSLVFLRQTFVKIPKRRITNVLTAFNPHQAHFLDLLKS